MKLLLKEDPLEYLEEKKIKEIVKKHVSEVLVQFLCVLNKWPKLFLFIP